MQFSPHAPLTGQMTHFEAQALTLDDPRPHPHEEALIQLGHALMNEVLDVFIDTALEDFQAIASESLIGAFHSAAQRIEREADRARDDLNRLTRDFDGSEIADTELQRIGLIPLASGVRLHLGTPAPLRRLRHSYFVSEPHCYQLAVPCRLWQRATCDFQAR